MSLTENLDFGAKKLSMIPALSDLQKREKEPEPGMFGGA
jgi:hypothetical protein